MTDEEFYDAEIGPRLLAVAQLCKERGFALVAYCQWSADDCGRTEQTPHGLWPATRIVQYAARAHGNVDALIMALQRDGEKHGHSSMALHLLGSNKQSGG